MKRISAKYILYPGLFGISLWVIFAQQASPDILADMSNAWSNFVSSGQLVAMIVGIAIGYLIRLFTSY
ncbi:hypothetical protein LQF76_05700 [Gloeomargaritales cyanobacterium VI4D9]|jgi:hypothetical protein|nr:hypothetical protein LQF76_05700 [Gloeomargaritales cyanobacterium VI4D9]